MRRLAGFMAVLVAASTVLVAAPAPVAAADTTTGVFLDGEPNEWVSAGDQWVLTPPDHVITTPLPDPSHGSATFHVDGSAWILAFNAPAGEALTAGMSYAATNGAPGPGQGVMWIGGDGRGCSRAVGSFTVHEVTFDASGYATVFAADFSQTCDDGRNATLFGAIRFNAQRGLRAMTIEPDDIDFGDTIVGTPTAAESVVIVNGGTGYIQFGGATIEGPGSAEFAIIDDGCTAIAPGEACTIEVAVDPGTRGIHRATLVTDDSTDRRSHAVALETTSYVSTSTSIVVTDVAPAGYSGPEVRATVTPAPTGGLIRYRWTNGVESGQTMSSVDPATGTNTYPLSLPPGPWAITAEFVGHDYFAPSLSDPIEGDVNVPTTTTLSSDRTPDAPGSATHLTAETTAAFGLQLPAGTLTIRAADGSVLATDSVGGSDKTVEATVCCLALGDHEFTATFDGSADALTSDATFVQRIAVPVPPVGSIVINSGASMTASPSVSLALPATDDAGPVWTIRISNDGSHWYTNPYIAETAWSLTDPTYGGSAADGVRTVYAQFADQQGTWSAVVSDTIILDLTQPSATSPLPALKPGAIATDGKAPISLGWTGGDATSGVARYELARSTDGGPWQAVATTTALATSVLLPPNHVYEFRVRAIDRAGNVGAWRAVRGSSLVATPESAATITYQGAWSLVGDASAIGGKVRRTIAPGASATFRFTGRSFAWVGAVGPTSGQVKVYVDGLYVTTLDQYRAAVATRQVLFTRSWTSNAVHTIKLVNLATAGRPRATIDGFFSLEGLPTGSISARR